MTDTARHWVEVSDPITWDGSDEAFEAIRAALGHGVSGLMVYKNGPDYAGWLEIEDGRTLDLIGHAVPNARIRADGDSFVILPPGVAQYATPKTYRKKPVEIEAMRVPLGMANSGVAAILEWATENRVVMYVHGNSASDFWITIPTLEGDMKASPGDFIIRGVQGEFYPCKSDIFEATYERVADDE